jgi:hypothetical protein
VAQRLQEPAHAVVLLRRAEEDRDDEVARQIHRELA